MTTAADYSNCLTDSYFLRAWCEEDHLELEGISNDQEEQPSNESDLIPVPSRVEGGKLGAEEEFQNVKDESLSLAKMMDQFTHGSEDQFVGEEVRESFPLVTSHIFSSA